MSKLIKKRWFKIFISVIAVLAIVITSYSLFNNGKDIKTTKDLVKALEAKGYKVEVSYPVHNYVTFMEFDGKERLITLDGALHIMFHEFENEEKAKVAAKAISKDGYTIGNCRVDIDGYPIQFYRKSNIIVEHYPNNLKLLWDIRNIMGKPVAGTPMHSVLYKKIFKKI